MQGAATDGTCYQTRRMLTRHGQRSGGVHLVELVHHVVGAVGRRVEGVSEEETKEENQVLTVGKLEARKLKEEEVPPDELAAVESLCESADAGFREALDDDLNISGALGRVHSFLTECYKTCVRRATGDRAVAQLNAWDGVLGVLDLRQDAVAFCTEAVSGGPSDEEIEALVRERDAARGQKDFASADRLRDQLQDMGIVLKDSPAGTRWHRGD